MVVGVLSLPFCVQHFVKRECLVGASGRMSRGSLLGAVGVGWYLTDLVEVRRKYPHSSNQRPGSSSWTIFRNMISL